MVIPPLAPKVTLFEVTLLPRTVHAMPHTSPSNVLRATTLSVMMALPTITMPAPMGEPSITFFVTICAGLLGGDAGNGITGGANTGPNGAPAESEKPKPVFPIIWLSCNVLPNREATPP